MSSNTSRLDIHFIHSRAGLGAKTVLPIHLVHGWPGSVLEYLKMIRFLTTPDLDGLAFEVICPSLPGFGWSSAAARPGLNQIHTARIFVKLMERLGHRKFYYQGGDLGAIVGKVLASLYPDRVRGASLQLLQKSIQPLVMNISTCLYPVVIWDDWSKTGYLHIQATRPDTVGVGLNDSPAGLAAWILEKFIKRSNESHMLKSDLSALASKFSLDDLLTNVMIYWLTGSITSSARFYKEIYNFETQVDQYVNQLTIPSSVPVSITAFPNEIVTNVDESAAREAAPGLIRYTKMDRGGHFGAFEEPELLSNEIRDFVRQTLLCDQ